MKVRSNTMSLQDLYEFCRIAKYSLFLTGLWGLFVVAFFPHCFVLVLGIYLLGCISLYKLLQYSHNKNDFISKCWAVFMLFNFSLASDILSSIPQASNNPLGDISALTKVLLICLYPLLFTTFTFLMRVVQRFC